MRRLELKPTLWLITLAAALVSSAATAQDEWELLPDMRNVRDMVWLDGRIWCATEGGLMSYNPATDRFDQYNALDGLGGMGIATLATDAAGGIWLAFDNRLLQRFKPGEGVTHTITALEKEGGISRFYDLAIDDAGLFIATSRGIVHAVQIVRYNRWVIYEEHRRLGSFADGEAVLAVEIADGYLWAGTAAGIARADASAEGLTGWENHTVLDGLPGNTVRDLKTLHGRIFAATNEGTAEWDGAGWTLHSGKRDATRLAVGADSLRAVSSTGAFTWEGSTWVAYGSQRQYLVDLAWDGTGRGWVAPALNVVSPGGIATPDGDGWLERKPMGPISNLILSTAFTEDGGVLMVGGRGGGQFGLSYRSGDDWRLWTGLDYPGRVFGYENRSVVPDLDGGIWLSSYGGGIARVNPDGGVQTYDYSEETGRRLIGYDQLHQDYVVVDKMALDHAGNLWVMNRSAANGEVLVCVPRDFIQDPSLEKEWRYFHRSLFNNYPHFDLIAIDGRGRQWIATSSDAVIAGRGVYVFDSGATLDDTTDDRSWGPILQGLNSPQALCIAWDPAGYIWVGSIDGAYWINANVDNPLSQLFTRIYQLRDVQVNAVAIDESGNRWFGTNSGVTVLGADLFTIVHQINDEPPDMLPSPRVKSIAINPHTGWAYIGTEDGVAALRTPYRSYGDAVQSVSITPNPFNPNEGRLDFEDSLGGGAAVRLFTPDGRVVRRLSHEQAAIGWDGLNDEGYPVADGIYLILIHSADGGSSQGKVAVIWR